MRKILTATAAITLMMTMAVLTACTSDNDDNPVNGVDGRMVGKWCADVSGKTFAKWNYGETWQVTELKADGTGTTDIYYTNKDKPIAREHRDFTYAAAEAAALTEGLKKADGAMTARFDAWGQTEDLIPVPQPSKFTVFVYGNAGGTMDTAIEKGFWEVAKKFLTDDRTCAWCASTNTARTCPMPPSLESMPSRVTSCGSTSAARPTLRRSRKRAFRLWASASRPSG